MLYSAYLLLICCCKESTIISLLERLYDPDQGSIVFGEVNLRVMNLKAHREKIGLVTQDPVLFSGSSEHSQCC